MAMMAGCFPINFCHQDASCWVLEAEVHQDMEEPVESMAKMTGFMVAETRSWTAGDQTRNFIE
jgi:hypothetical protein